MRDFTPTRQHAGPIWSAQSEREVIGAALYSADRVSDAFERLQAEHFYDPVHARIWKIVASLFSAGHLIDAGVIAHRMGTDPAFEEWGGQDHLLNLVEISDLRAARGHIDIIADLATRRAIEATARKAAERARDTSDASGDEILGDMERESAEIAETSSIETAWIDAGDMLDQAIAIARARDGAVNYPIGLQSVDEKLRGLNAGEVTVIAGWTGMGKTVAGMQVAKGCASVGLGVAYFSLEMSEVPMAMRMACDVVYDRTAAAYGGVTSNITIDRAIAGDLKPHEWERLNEAQATIRRWPISYDMRPNLTVAQIQAAVVRLHRVWKRQGIKPGPVIVDHIGKVKPSQERRGNVTAETRDVSNDLNAMAKRLGVPVVILSQLNRTVDQGPSKDKRPTLSSVKDSGAVVEDARQLIFVYRPEYYYREPFDHEDTVAKAERLAELTKVQNHYYWIIEKNSNGPRAQIRTYCKAECSAVRDWTV
nr:DnaB-like helicase C-terminal domain-containing protein [uncultured Brevundimonas sp.]